MSDDTAYLQKIVENGKIYLNGNSYQAVDQKLYRLKDNILVLDSSLFAVNKDNQVTIKVDGYEDKVFNIAIAKDLKEVALEAGGDFKTGAEVTITNTAVISGRISRPLYLQDRTERKRDFFRMDRRAFLKRSDIRSVEQVWYSEKISLKRLASTVWRSRRSIMV